MQDDRKESFSDGNRKAVSDGKNEGINAPKGDTPKGGNTKEELILGELEEVVGIFKGFSIGKTFMTIKVGRHEIILESEAESTKSLVERLKRLRKGSRIGLLRYNGGIRVRNCEGVEG